VHHLWHGQGAPGKTALDNDGAALIKWWLALDVRVLAEGRTAVSVGAGDRPNHVGASGGLTKWVSILDPRMLNCAHWGVFLYNSLQRNSPVSAV
jgi:hypothetical protein